MRLQDIPPQELTRYFKCDATTGVLTRATTTARGAVGAVVGSADAHGRWRVYLRGMMPRRAQVVWAMHYGIWPAPGLVLDHINGNCADDRVCNLRCITQGQNSQNRKVQSNSRSGIPGVYLDRNTGRFRVKIRLQRKEYYGGVFKYVRDAADAAARLRLKLHPYARSERVLPAVAEQMLDSLDARAAEIRASNAHAASAD